MKAFATIPRLAGPLSRHQKYFLQSRGLLKKPSSLHSNAPTPGSGVGGGEGVVTGATTLSESVLIRRPADCLMEIIGVKKLLEYCNHSITYGLVPFKAVMENCPVLGV